MITSELANPLEYFSQQEWEKIKSFADSNPTPFVAINLDNIKKKYQELKTNFPLAKIYYAVKANPGNEIISLLKDLGSNFDIASIYELDKVMNLGVTADRLSYGNTIKKRQDIAEFYKRGVRLFATDSEPDLRNIAEVAPGSKVYVRVLTEGSATSDWPLSRKFGCHVDMAIDLLVLAKKLGLEPYGISFHVGSQQRDINVWDAALAKVQYIFNWLKTEENIKLKMINMGGGFPAHYLNRVNDISTYAKEILRFLGDDFNESELPEIILEPGRSLVAEAGVIVTEVVLAARKSKNELYRWVFIDIGKFSGMIETLDEAIKYPLYYEQSGPVEEAVIAGPTCDSVDILYENFKYHLPLDLKAGDRLYWLATGAYTTSYSSIEFNGFPPLKAYYI
ncbi:MAG: ornithine decarboxylase [Gammaproteobacteria bacterium]|nr:ornithine decarboxylase [Gammaproteobacteria bacterium]